MAYTLPVATIAQGDVGTLYHLGLGYTDPTLGAISYGYCLVNEQGGVFSEGVDVVARQQLLTASPSIIDRDLVTFPRETQSIFSGGQGQSTFIDPTRYADSDLDVSTPGYVRLSAGWVRAALASPTASAIIVGPVASLGGSFFVMYYVGGTSSLRRLFNGTVTTIAITMTNPVYALSTDGSYLFLSDGTSIYRYTSDGLNETQVTAAVNGTLSRIWAVKQGTNGWRLYYDSSNGNLYYIDLTAGYPVAAGAHVQVLVGGQPFTYTDIVPYGTGIAILANDTSLNPNSFDVWYDDGASFTRIIHQDGMTGKGMCVAGGDLYVSAQAYAGIGDQPTLYRVTGSSIEAVAKAGWPAVGATAQTAGQPVSSGRYLLWPVTCSMNGINAGPYICMYEMATGVLRHLPSYGDSAETMSYSQVAAIGECIATCAKTNSGGQNTGWIQVLMNNTTAQTTFNFAATGWLVTARYDFNTPGISKLVRRVIVRHSPLKAGEAVYVEAHLDQDPLAFTTSLGPNPAAASKTNSTLGSTTTELDLPIATIGYSAYHAIKLTAGTSSLTTPDVYSITTEISTPWAWKFKVDCTSQRLNLSGQSDRDMQGVRGKDLYYLLHNAWENALTLVFYHPNGQTYNAVIEDLSFDMRSPQMGRVVPQRDPQDFDSWATVTLRQVA